MYYIKSIIEMCIIFLIIGLIIWIRYKKIPIMCIACEDEGVFTKCMPNTGKNSTTCNMYKGIKKTIDNIDHAYSDVMDKVTKIETAFTKPIEEIQKAIEQLEKAFSHIKIPEMPPIPSIPTINIDVKIDFSKIPSFDPCNQIVNPLVNGLTNPINTFVNDLQSVLKSITDGMNKAIQPIEKTITDFNKSVGDIIDTGNTVINGLNDTLHIGMPTIPSSPIPAIKLSPLSMPPLDKIGNINLSCNIDFAQLIEHIVKDLLAVGKIITDSINDNVIQKMNGFLLILKNALDQIRNTLNDTMQLIITSIQEQITRTIGFLKDQLVVLNVFNKIIPRIQTLIKNVKIVDFPSLFKSFILPPIQNLVPWASVGDILLLIILFILFPYIFRFLTIIFKMLDFVEIGFDTFFMSFEFIIDYVSSLLY